MERATDKNRRAEAKPRVCMILPRKLFPLLSGYSLKNYYLIQLLAKKYEIHLFIISSEALENSEIEFYQKYTERYSVYRMSKLERLSGAVSAFLTGFPIQVGLYYSQKLLKVLKGEESAQTDIFISELVRTMPYEKAFGINTVKVFDMVDSIGLNYQRSIGGTHSVLLKMYYRMETKRLLRYEEDCVGKADISFLFNREEQEYWAKAGNVRWLPHGVKEELLTYSAPFEETGKPYVAFIGKMNYQPNVDAVLWYAEHIHSKLKQKIPFVIVGAYPTAEVQRLQEKYEDITVTGFVDDPYAILSGALAVVAPMKTGGGIQNKVLEAMAIGKVNLLSERAARPIAGAKDGTHFLVCESLQDYEAALEKLSCDSEWKRSIEENAKTFIRDNFTWEKYGERYLDYLEEIRNEGADCTN